MNYTALSLSQTPPLAVPLRFLLTAPLFSLAAALVLLFHGELLAYGRWSPAMLAITHLFTLGFLAMSMMGAMQQLLPVLVGVTLRRPGALSRVLHLLLTSGTLLLTVGMGLGKPLLLQLGGGVLTIAVSLFVLMVASALWRSSSAHATVHAMALAVVALLFTLAVPLYLLMTYRWQLPLAHPFTALHIGWGTLGWVGLLLIGVAYQVVPMFQITPQYPPRLLRHLAPLLGGGLLLWGVLHWRWPAAIPTRVVALLLVGGFTLFALQTLRLQARRKRRLTDVTLDFWRLAMVSLLAALGCWVMEGWWPDSRIEIACGVLFLLGFAASAVNGMLYKIVPFLLWLHLNNLLQREGRWQGTVPNMKQYIPERQTRGQFRLHLATLVALLLALLLPGFPLAIAALMWGASALWLWLNLFSGLQCYRRIANSGE